ncbi:MULTISPECIES: BRO-N domain-containing protein [unclassified Halomonas]|uniref:BRO-N domain-containing protein n=1 Tax=unclassified Halomonas TaxID=2609666 RepID=UPI0004B9E6FD|nr:MULTISPECIES: BRO family protein [unclassified Halomonas]
MNISTDMQPLATPFLFQQAEVRTATDEKGEAWFCAKDVFDALEITWSNKRGSLRGVPEEWICPLYLKGQRGSGEVLFLSEAAVYRVLFRSNKPQAVEFANWVCGEVLPTLRKQGFFGQVPVKERLGFSRQIITVTRELMRCRNAFHQHILLDELRDLYRMVGKPLSDFSAVSLKPSQMPLL